MERVDRENSNLTIPRPDIGGGEIFYYHGTPFNGIVEERFANGILKTEVRCVNGYPQGFEREYFDNGQMLQESFIKFNLPYGLMREWDRNGSLINQYNWGPEP